MKGKKVYFLSDVHLGSAFHKKNVDKFQEMTLPSTRAYNSVTPLHDIERKLCRWFDMVKKDASEIYLLGDIFDYWFEYRDVVPRGFVRFLGKVAEITDMGIPVHFFIGNHDIWVTDYLQKECGMTVHLQPLVRDINGKKFFLAHGDGLGDENLSFKILRKIFHSKICRIAYAAIHPRWTVGFAHWWSNHNRENDEMPPYFGENKEHLVVFAKKHLQMAPNINFFIFGHRHIMLDLALTASGRVVILGDWINYFSYGVFDGENFSLEIFDESSQS
ncbi:UDP-2,3-diacylglucosamine diphosphatase [Dysgonomonas sp. BGC7]|uniref:UDP-2,3-diacylglucosamine diphosphatase n=1 Tax=Dysgonomonas sp. BGC7 TaxID=1658008 RepID=UPI0006811304|nr:UDP-2,3-diacylglucosamine diphosphatase [Dysgonomonas sp. BGC7]MBD8389687.1 UDP-2,3-diacylglucosamine diphosphatase [Dysgonomonas sp. BGC7]